MYTLKKALLKLVNFGENLEGSLKDHKISFLEGANLSGSLAIAIFFCVQNFKDLKEDIDSITAENTPELLDWFKKNIDLENDRAEQIFERTLELIVQVYNYIQVYKS